MRTTIEVHGSQEVIRNITLFEAATKARLKVAIATSAMLIQNEARKRAPVDTGRLRADIKTQYSNGGLTAHIGTKVHYAPYVEFGTRPHWPPAGALDRWGQLHGIPGFLVARAISRRGTKPQPFLFPAWESNKVKVRRLIRGALMW